LLKLQNQKIEAESQEKSEFIVNIIHDLRSPLAGIAGLASHLLEKTKNSEEKEYAKIIFEGSKQLLDLMNAVIDSKEAFKQDNQYRSKFYK
ncbi:histidine kinase dimerization/phospho-acceptor domain-containing protein, partial [Legionella sp.]